MSLRALGFDVKKPEVLKMIKDYDREGNGKITQRDFFTIGVCGCVCTYLGECACVFVCV